MESVLKTSNPVAGEGIDIHCTAEIHQTKTPLVPLFTSSMAIGSADVPSSFILAWVQTIEGHSEGKAIQTAKLQIACKTNVQIAKTSLFVAILSIPHGLNSIVNSTDLRVSYHAIINEHYEQHPPENWSVFNRDQQNTGFSRLLSNSNPFYFSSMLTNSTNV